MLPTSANHPKGAKRKQPLIETGKKATQSKGEQPKTEYNPFNSPHILRLPTGTFQAEGAHCRKLFEESPSGKSTLNSTRDESVFEGIEPDESAEEFQPNAETDSGELVRCFFPKEFPTFNKENMRKQQKIGFNKLKQVKHNETPLFKVILSTPLIGVDREFQNKIELLQARVHSAPLTALPIDADPLQHLQDGYKFFFRLAEGKRKDQCCTSMRALYKIGLYLQPYDEGCWEWAVRFQEDCGDYHTSSRLARTGYMFTTSDILAEKYICLQHKLSKSGPQLARYADLLPTMLEWPKVEKRYRVMYELARVCWAFGEQRTTLKILMYLVRVSESNFLFIPELAKYYEANGQSFLAYELLMKTIEKRSIKTPIIYFHCLKFAEDMLDDDDLIQALDFLLERFSDSMQTDSRWRLLLEIGLVYQRLKQTKQAQRCLSTALELAPNLLKLKVYLAILRIVGKKPEPLRISQVILDINRDRFVNGQAAVSYAFQEWKYYFHYSLFYLVNRDQQALGLIQGATTKWPYSGRLAAETLFIQRVGSTPQLLVDKWAAVASELPKSGEVWCQGGRIYMELQEWQRARFCFESAIQLTPQYGDSFIEAYKLCLLTGDYQGAKKYKYVTTNDYSESDACRTLLRKRLVVPQGWLLKNQRLVQIA